MHNLSSKYSYSDKWGALMRINLAVPKRRPVCRNEGPGKGRNGGQFVRFARVPCDRQAPEIAQVAWVSGFAAAGDRIAWGGQWSVRNGTDAHDWRYRAR